MTMYVNLSSRDHMPTCLGRKYMIAEISKQAEASRTSHTPKQAGLASRTSHTSYFIMTDNGSRRGG